MSYRGVIFVSLIIFFGLASSSFGFSKSVISGDASGGFSLNPFSYQSTLTLFLENDVTDQHQLQGEVVVSSSSKREFDFTLANWAFTYNQNEGQNLSLSYNHPLITSQDFFRVLHQNYYSPNHLAMIYRQENPSLVLVKAEQALSRNPLPSDLSYFQVSGNSQDWIWQLTGARYDSGYYPDLGRYNGQIIVAETSFQDEDLLMEIAAAYQKRQEHADLITDYHGVALVTKFNFEAEKLRVTPTFLYVGNDFDWPFTRSKPYPNNRIGFTSQTRYTNNPWQLTLNYDRLKNQISDRSYDSTNLRIIYRDQGRVITVTAYWHPNPRVILAYRNSGFELEWRADLAQLRLNYTFDKHQIRLTSSSFDLNRIEYRYNGGLSVRLIYKHEASSERHFFHVSTRLTRSNSWYELSYGENDNGQLNAGFEQSPHLKFAWGWSW